jgi:hypothetical protein
VQIKIFNIILTYDKKSSSTFVLSADKKKIVLPYFIINNPHLIRSEIRYLTKSLFDDPRLSYPELIEISYLDIQNSILIDYIESEKEIYEYDKDKDLCIYSGIVLTEKNKSSFFWLPINNIQKEKIEPIDIVIDFTIKNLML